MDHPSNPPGKAVGLPEGLSAGSANIIPQSNKTRQNCPSQSFQTLDINQSIQKLEKYLLLGTFLIVKSLLSVISIATSAFFRSVFLSFYFYPTCNVYI